MSRPPGAAVSTFSLMAQMEDWTSVSKDVNTQLLSDCSVRGHEDMSSWVGPSYTFDLLQLEGKTKVLSLISINKHNTSCLQLMTSLWSCPNLLHHQLLHPDLELAPAPLWLCDRTDGSFSPVRVQRQRNESLSLLFPATIHVPSH